MFSRVLYTPLLFFFFFFFEFSLELSYISQNFWSAILLLLYNLVIKLLFGEGDFFLVLENLNITAQKMFSMKDFFSKCDEIRSFFRIWSHLLKKSLMVTSFFAQCILKNFQDFSKILIKYET